MEHEVVIPKPVPDRLGLGSGAAIEVVEVDGVVVATGTDLPPLTDDVVRETIEGTRR